MVSRPPRKNEQYVVTIESRINKDELSKCEAVISSRKNLRIFSLYLDAFLKLDESIRKDCISEVSVVIDELVAVDGIGFSKATKILHTIYPQIIPIIDKNLQEIYQTLKPKWKQGDWNKIFMDYYDNFLVEDTYVNLSRVHRDVSHLDRSFLLKLLKQHTRR